MAATDMHPATDGIRVPAPGAAPALGPQESRVIWLLLAAAFVAILNETTMGVAIPHLITDLGITALSAQWLTTAFMLTMAVVIPITGFLLRRFTTRAMFVAAMGLFSLGTLIALLSPGFPMLLAARVVQASGTAIMMPLLMTSVMTLVSPDRRGRMMGNISIVMSVAPAIGPAAAGLILHYLEWRWIFIIVLPVGLGALALGLGLGFNETGGGITQLLAQNLPGFRGRPNVRTLLVEAREALDRDDFAGAREKLTPLLETGAYLPGSDNFHTLLARAAAGQIDTATERDALLAIATHEADALAPVTRLLSLARDEQDWTAVARWADAWLAINPLAPTPWRALLDAHEHTGDHAAAAHAGETLLRLDPPDFASLHFRVAQQLQSIDPDRARRHTLQALEEAPRFRAAYDLLATLPPSP